MWLRLLAIFTALVLTSSAHAAGFEVLMHSSESPGTAFAGGVVGYGDGSSAYFNPAAMAVIEKTTVTNAATVVSPSIEFSDQGSLVSGLANIGSESSNGGELALIPSFQLVHPLNERLRIGFIANLPFGLATEYDRRWAGRYQGVRSEVAVLQMGTAVSYDLTPSLSVGGRLGAMYADTELSNALDFGSIAFGVLGATTTSSLGLAPQANDGFLKVEGDDWGLSWGLGVMYRYGSDKQNRIGVSFRGKTNFNISGSAEYEVPTEASVLTAGGAFTNTDVRASFSVPDSISFGIRQELSEKLTLLYESQWTQWSRFEEIRLRFGNPAQPESITPQDWDNAWRHSLALHYQATKSWTFTGGVSYDQTPIPGATRRYPRLPEGDIFWFGAGAQYQASDNILLKVGYIHAHLKDRNSDTIGPTGDRLVGKWNVFSNTVSATLVWQI